MPGVYLPLLLMDDTQKESELVGDFNVIEEDSIRQVINRLKNSCC